MVEQSHTEWRQPRRRGHAKVGSEPKGETLQNILNSLLKFKVTYKITNIIQQLITYL